MNFFSLIKSAVVRFFTKSQPVISHEMQTQSEIWHNIYINNGIWLKNDVISLRLPTAITSELSRLVFTESEIVTDEKSPYKTTVDDFVSRIPDEFETALALGGMMFKPYLSHGKIFIDLIRADCFLPLAFAEKTMTAAVFVSRKTVGSTYFTLLEYHEFDSENHTHTIKKQGLQKPEQRIYWYGMQF